MSAIFVSLKLCLTGIERCLLAKMSKDHPCKNNLFEITAQVLIKQNIFLGI